MNSINDFYTKIDINADAVDRIIATSKTAKPHKTVNRIAVIVSTCAATMVIGVFSVLMFQMTKATNNNTNDLFTYSNIEKFEGVTVGGDTLQSHDGIALWINGAYLNGHKMYVAVKGECLQSDWADGSLPDILKYTAFSDEQAYFSINDIPVKPVGDKIVLTKNRNYYEGVVQFDFENEESLVYLKMNLPTIDAYYDGTFTKTVFGPFDMSNVISREAEELHGVLADVHMGIEHDLGVELQGALGSGRGLDTVAYADALNNGKAGIHEYQISSYGIYHSIKSLS